MDNGYILIFLCRLLLILLVLSLLCLSKQMTIRYFCFSSSGVASPVTMSKINHPSSFTKTGNTRPVGYVSFDHLFSPEQT